MLNYIHGELWRLFRRAGWGILFLCCVCLAAAVNIGTAAVCLIWEVSPVPISNALFVIDLLAPMTGAFLVLLVYSMAFGDDYRHGAFKNAVSSGISRPVLYMGKFLSALFSCLLLLGAMLAAFLMTGPLLPGATAAEFAAAAGHLGWLTAACIPIWIGEMAVIHTFYFFFRTDGPVIGAGFLFLILSGWLIPQLPFAGSSDLYLPVWFFIIPQADLPAVAGKAWAVGMGYAAVFLAAGYLGFFRRELK